MWDIAYNCCRPDPTGQCVTVPASVLLIGPHIFFVTLASPWYTWGSEDQKLKSKSHVLNLCRPKQRMEINTQLPALQLTTCSDVAVFHLLQLLDDWTKQWDDTVITLPHPTRDCRGLCSLSIARDSEQESCSREKTFVLMRYRCLS